MPGYSPFGRTGHACGSSRFRSARGVDGRRAECLLRDGSLRKLSNCTRATLSDRPGLLKGFVGNGVALREFKHEG